MSRWPIHPELAMSPETLGLTDGDRVQLPEPESPLHADWLAYAGRLRGVAARAVPVEDTARLERALREEPGLLGDAALVGVFGTPGSGRTSVVLGLAMALIRRSVRVALLDADLSAPSLRRRLRCDVTPLVVGGLVLPYVADGMRMQGLDAFWPQPGALPWQGAELRRVMERYRADVLWARPDVLLIDMPPLGDPRLADVHAFFGGLRVRVAGPFESAVWQPSADFTVRNAADGAGDVRLPYVGTGDLLETFSTRLFDLSSALSGAKGSGSVS